MLSLQYFVALRLSTTLASFTLQVESRALNDDGRLGCGVVVGVRALEAFVVVGLAVVRVGVGALGLLGAVHATHVGVLSYHVDFTLLGHNLRPRFLFATH